MLISDELFDAYLNCETKTHLIFGRAGTDELSHPISDWRRRVAENYQANCRDRLQSEDNADCFIGSPRAEDLRSAKYRLIIGPHVIAEDVESHIHALGRGPAPTQKRHSPYAPIRFVPFEKISRHHRFMLAFDACVLWKASGQMPTKGIIIHGSQHTTFGVKLETPIHEVESFVGNLRNLLTKVTPPAPILIKHCSECIFEACCRAKVTEKDDLSLLDGLKTRPSQAERKGDIHGHSTRLYISPTLPTQASGLTKRKISPCSQSSGNSRPEDPRRWGAAVGT